MRLRQAKKIMGWCKGEGNSRSKDHRDSFWRKIQKLRPGYRDERGHLGATIMPRCGYHQEGEYENEQMV